MSFPVTLFYSWLLILTGTAPWIRFRLDWWYLLNTYPWPPTARVPALCPKRPTAQALANYVSNTSSASSNSDLLFRDVLWLRLLLLTCPRPPCTLPLLVSSDWAHLSTLCLAASASLVHLASPAQTMLFRNSQFAKQWNWINSFTQIFVYM